MTFTIDSSVFVAAFVKSETSSQLAYDFLQKIVTEGHEVIIPVTVLIEASLAVARRADQKLTDELQDFILSLPNIRMIELDFDAALDVVGFGKSLGLRGMDAIVAYVASEFNSSLVSLDQEMIKKLKQQAEIYLLEQ